MCIFNVQNCDFKSVPSLRAAFFHPRNAMPTEPAVSRASPVHALAESRSLNTNTEKSTVTKMLMRSMGTTMLTRSRTA